MTKNGEESIWNEKLCALYCLWVLSCKQEPEFSRCGCKISMCFGTEVSDFPHCIFSYLFSLPYTLQQERSSRNCVQSPVINMTGRDHLCSNRYYFVHQVSACYNRASLCWAKAEGNLLTSAELFCIHLSMAENSILCWMLLNWADNLQFSLISGLFSILHVLVQTLLFTLSIIHPD